MLTDDGKRSRFYLVEEMLCEINKSKIEVFEFIIDSRKNGTLTNTATSVFFRFLNSTVDLIVDGFNTIIGKQLDSIHNLNDVPSKKE